MTTKKQSRGVTAKAPKVTREVLAVALARAFEKAHRGGKIRKSKNPFV